MNISTIITSILTGLESKLGGVVMAVLAVFMPQLVTVSEQDFQVIATNFSTFIRAITSGTPVGQALADMLTADWNEVQADAKTIATDFADAVGKALQALGIAT